MELASVVSLQRFGALVGEALAAVELLQGVHGAAFVGLGDGVAVGVTVLGPLCLPGLEHLEGLAFEFILEGRVDFLEFLSGLFVGAFGALVFRQLAAGVRAVGVVAVPGVGGEWDGRGKECDEAGECGVGGGRDLVRHGTDVGLLESVVVKQ